jgi:hypothetical protein
MRRIFCRVAPEHQQRDLAERVVGSSTDRAHVVQAMPKDEKGEIVNHAHGLVFFIFKIVYLVSN